jgi:hypothetical protein
MSNGKVTLNGPLVGGIALACMAISVGLWIAGFNGEESSVTTTSAAGAAFFRVGLLMGALWLALPPKGQEAAWAQVTPGTFVGLILAIYAVVRLRWMAIPLIIGFALFAVMLRPRMKYRPPRN